MSDKTRDAGLKPCATDAGSVAQAFGLADFLELAVDAARGGDAETLRRAIAAGVPVNATTPRGDSLLMLACYYGHIDAVRVLLDHGADVNQPDGRGQSPLAGVAFKGLIEVAELLVAAGAPVDAPSPDRRTPLMMAAAFNRRKMVSWLLAHGASPDACDAAGLRAIDIARAMGASDSIGALTLRLGRARRFPSTGLGAGRRATDSDASREVF
jgi:uncharacterized protein